MTSSLSDRQLREIEYHREYSKGDYPLPSLDIVHSAKRRWWNAYWHTYTYLRSQKLFGKRACVIGCGFGNDAVFLGALGAQVYASDLSSEMIAAAQRRFAGRAEFATMPAEKLEYPDAFFDLIVAVDILHHVDIPATMKEVRRVAKPGAIFVWDEIYCHSSVGRLRHSALGELAYRLLKSRVYENDTPYITEDERPLSERDISFLKSSLSNVCTDYFNFAIGRVLSDAHRTACKLDRSFLRLLGPLRAVAACRVIGHGVVGGGLGAAVVTQSQ